MLKKKFKILSGKNNFYLKKNIFDIRPGAAAVRHEGGAADDGLEPLLEARPASGLVVGQRIDDDPERGTSG